QTPVQGGNSDVIRKGRVRVVSGRNLIFCCSNGQGFNRHHASQIISVYMGNIQNQVVFAVKLLRRGDNGTPDTQKPASGKPLRLQGVCDKSMFMRCGGSGYNNLWGFCPTCV